MGVKPSAHRFSGGWLLTAETEGLSYVLVPQGLRSRQWMERYEEQPFDGAQ